MQKSLFKRILYATDMSDRAIVSSHYALRMSHDYNAHLTIVTVIPDEIEEMSANMSYDLSSHYGKDQLDRFTSDTIDENRKVLTERINSICSKMKTQLGDCLVTPNVSIRCGDTVEQILLEAETDQSDLIIVGTNRHNLLDKIMLGNVAKEVVLKSQVPVITIPLAHFALYHDKSTKADSCEVENDKEIEDEKLVTMS